MEGVEGKDGVSRAGDDELCQGQVHQQPVERGAELKFVTFKYTVSYVEIFNHEYKFLTKTVYLF